MSRTVGKIEDSKRFERDKKVVYTESRQNVM